jgi:hypothetical protein
MRRLGIFAATALAVACSSYDPQLPRQPFLCGSGEPRCPDGYTCMADGPNRMVCNPDGEPAPDGSISEGAAAIARP